MEYLTRMGEMRNAYILVERLERELATRRRRCEDNIKMYLREVWKEWIHLDQDRFRRRVLVNIVTNLWVQ
jgi:sulfatase maturation enzyme AslB (radical SAM superfamily)